MDRRNLAVAHERGDRDQVLAEVDLQATQDRDDLLETAVVLDVPALCRPPGGCLPLPYHEEPGGPDEADELRTDASSVVGAWRSTTGATAGAGPATYPRRVGWTRPWLRQSSGRTARCASSALSLSAGTTKTFSER